jgi:hypothetical protein
LDFEKGGFAAFFFGLFHQQNDIGSRAAENCPYTV